MYVVLVVWKRLRSSQLCVTVLLNLPLQFSLGKVSMVPYHHLQKQWWYHTTYHHHMRTRRLFGIRRLHECHEHLSSASLLW